MCKPKCLEVFYNFFLHDLLHWYLDWLSFVFVLLTFKCEPTFGDTPSNLVSNFWAFLLFVRVTLSRQQSED